MLIYPGVAPLDVAGPLQVFGVSNFLAKQKLYDVVTVAPTSAPVPTPVGFSFLPTCAMAELALPVDTLLVSGGGGPDAGTTPEILDWLRLATPQSRRFGSVCTGAFALGAAGLLDGKRVATHWAFGAELARRNPEANVEVDPIFIRDGNLYSSAGISAGIDLALALVEEDHGRAFALQVARYLVLFLKRSGGQSQFSTELRAQFSGVPAIQKVQQWCAENLDGDLRVATLARQAAMSERTFIRTFREDTGTTPAEFVPQARLQAAWRLLEESRLAPKAIAQRCGFGSPGAMRRVFARTSASPARISREILRCDVGGGQRIIRLCRPRLTGRAGRYFSNIFAALPLKLPKYPATSLPLPAPFDSREPHARRVRDVSQDQSHSDHLRHQGDMGGRQGGAARRSAAIRRCQRLCRQARQMPDPARARRRDRAGAVRPRRRERQIARSVPARRAAGPAAGRHLSLRQCAA